MHAQHATRPNLAQTLRHQGAIGQQANQEGSPFRVLDVPVGRLVYFVNNLLLGEDD